MSSHAESLKSQFSVVNFFLVAFYYSANSHQRTIIFVTDRSRVCWYHDLIKFDVYMSFDDDDDDDASMNSTAEPG